MRVTLIARDVETPIPACCPASWPALRFDECHIDLVRLARFAGRG
jgi:hypothetical protein